MGCIYMWMMWVIMRIIHLLCFIHYHLRLIWSCMYYDSGLFDLYIRLYSQNLLVFACWWFLCILCNKRNFSDIPPGSLPGVPSLFHVPNGFTVKHKKSAKILCQCDTNRAGHFTLDAHASRPVACPPQWSPSAYVIRSTSLRCCCQTINFLRVTIK